MGKRILLADDSMTIQKLVEMAFVDTDHDLICVSHGQEAWDRMGDFRPHVVLADAIMPVLDGYGLCERIKTSSEFASTPVVLLTGRFQPYDENRAVEVQIDSRIMKPFVQEQLVELVEKLAADVEEPVFDEMSTEDKVEESNPEEVEVESEDFFTDDDLEPIDGDFLDDDPLDVTENLDDLASEGVEIVDSNTTIRVDQDELQSYLKENSPLKIKDELDDSEGAEVDEFDLSSVDEFDEFKEDDDFLSTDGEAEPEFTPDSLEEESTTDIEEPTKLEEDLGFSELELEGEDDLLELDDADFISDDDSQEEWDDILDEPSPSDSTESDIDTEEGYAGEESHEEPETVEEQAVEPPEERQEDSELEDLTVALDRDEMDAILIDDENAEDPFVSEPPVEVPGDDSPEVENDFLAEHEESAPEIETPSPEIEELALETEEPMIELDEPASDLEEPNLELEETVFELEEPEMELEETAFALEEVSDEGIEPDTDFSFSEGEQEEMLSPGFLEKDTLPLDEVEELGLVLDDDADTLPLEEEKVTEFSVDIDSEITEPLLEIESEPDGEVEIFTDEGAHEEDSPEEPTDEAEEAHISETPSDSELPNLDDLGEDTIPGAFRSELGIPEKVSEEQLESADVTDVASSDDEDEVLDLEIEEDAIDLEIQEDALDLVIEEDALDLVIEEDEGAFDLEIDEDDEPIELDLDNDEDGLDLDLEGHEEPEFEVPIELLDEPADLDSPDVELDEKESHPEETFDRDETQPPDELESELSEPEEDVIGFEEDDVIEDAPMVEESLADVISFEEEDIMSETPTEELQDDFPLDIEHAPIDEEPFSDLEIESSEDIEQDLMNKDDSLLDEVLSDSLPPELVVEEEKVLDEVEYLDTPDEPVIQELVASEVLEEQTDERVVTLSDEQFDQLVEHVVEKVVKALSGDAIKEVAWEVVPALAEAMVQRRIFEMEKDK